MVRVVLPEVERARDCPPVPVTEKLGVRARVPVVKVGVDEASRVVVDTSVAPVIAPKFEIFTEGVQRKLVKPLEDSKLIPLTVSRAFVFVAPGKSIPLRVLVLSVLLALVRAIFTP